MTRKITLSIPDMLHEKMEEWRKSFNLSKMFQEALTEAIQKKEAFQKRLQEDHDLVDIIERLRYEKMQSEGNYSENGRIEGIEWVKKAHYDDLLYVLDFFPLSSMVTDPRLDAYFSPIITKDPLMEITPEGINKYTKLFIEGWHRGVVEFWNEIKEKI
ncbi:hypothetical protein SAMN02746065_10348 [Desulfocicer vacuolatum DSM 3385]|uniref:Uncharacterized protein n=1 Tax=Desulfocicer vacuolatum DSM 3385 TaxID=1121400 RepID=A0A1W1ZNG0_9BACT|nr:hypothetical protein [Desulfocicer vacuolatum]SMC49793.1 hypothetical protein SAMN02746065_10348 [Desulfocicer vacuolatum DSM 3385]